VIKHEINRHDPRKPVQVVPIMSNFGEPPLSSLAGKLPKRWAIAGGTALIERSLRAFAEIKSSIPTDYFPNEVEVVGGFEDPRVRNQFRVLGESLPGVAFRHHPQVSAARASAILAPCAFGWLDYFGEGKAWPGMIFKSSSFAAFCAHGIVPILSHPEPKLWAGTDPFPGPFFISTGATQLPKPENLEEIQRTVRAWYDGNASSARTAAVYAEALK
jgi:hypothetical protein